MIRVIVFSFIITACSSYQVREQTNKYIYRIYFVDSFNQNEVSLKLNDIEILKPTYFRTSDIPQLRQVHDLSVGITKDNAFVFSKGKSISQSPVRIIDESVNLVVVIDKQEEVLPLVRANGSKILIEYTNGDIKIKQDFVPD
ncbi:MAG: hypothetical protein AAGC43_04145 [Bacteroidota bacterium]